MEKLFLSSPHMSGDEMSYIKEAFDTNWIAPLGRNVDRFEEEMAEYIGVKSSVALSSGTAALHMALKAAGVGKGDIVFCSSLTFSASANPIIYENATPVFIDSEYETWNMDPVALEAAFRKYPEAKAVIVVDLYGLPAKWREIKEVCQRYNAVIIEDSAEALGAEYYGEKCGLFGKYGVLSFNGNKIITTSGGGMLISDDEERISKVRFWSTQSREAKRHYQHNELGYNYRMSNVLAGIGIGQLHILGERVGQKTKIFKGYKKAFDEIDEIEMMPTMDNTVPNYWLSCMTIKKTSKVTPLDIILALERENIESRPIWKPMHMQPYFEEYDFFSTQREKPVCEDIFKRGVCLPSDTKMTKKQQQKVIEIIKNCFLK